MMLDREFKTLKTENRDGVLVVYMDNPPVNQLSDHFTAEIQEAVTGAFLSENVKAVVVTGTGKNFIAGADLKEIYRIREKELLLRKVRTAGDFYNRIELASKPVIAAINGNALGGGLELALACHYRVALKNAVLGLPEVQVGLIPGAGGTQRLPRLVGLEDGMNMIASGLAISAEKAASLGLVDELAVDAVQAAVDAARRFVSGDLSLEAARTRNRGGRLPSASKLKDAAAKAKATAMKRARGCISELKAIEAMEKGLSLDIQADMDREVELFCDCALSDPGRSVMATFLNTRSAGRLPRIEGVQPTVISKVAVLGGGVMGSGIVHLLLICGFEALLWDINDVAVEKGMASLKKTFEPLLAKKRMAEADLEKMLAERFRTTTSLEDARDADLVIEAVLEDMSVKQDVWRKLDAVCKPETVFATNTSALPITEMATALRDPSRMIGLHFFNPAQRMQLLEIICTGATSNQTLATSVAFARKIRKVPIVVNDGPGFYVTRQLITLPCGAMHLMADGIGVAQIDRAIKEFGMPMGPAELQDLTGIDIGFHVEKTFERELGERYKVHPLTELIYQTGCYGRKTGSGYMDYSGERPVPNSKVAEVIEKYLSDNGVSPREASGREIVEALLALAINEAALMIEEGICDRPQDMDLAMVYGAGFPQCRGGVLRYADNWGPANVYDKLVELEGRYGPRFKPAALLEDMAAAGKTFHQE
jgi:3-hydroxyacyl-CoA dehydrogenase/enoyl-CoA hydratase/carnithine racemase